MEYASFLSVDVFQSVKALRGGKSYLYCITMSQATIEGSQLRNSSRHSKQETWRKVFVVLATCPGIVPSTAGWTFPHYILVKITLPRHSSRPIPQRTFSGQMTVSLVSQSDS